MVIFYKETKEEVWDYSQKRQSETFTTYPG